MGALTLLNQTKRYQYGAARPARLIARSGDGSCAGLHPYNNAQGLI